MHTIMANVMRTAAFVILVARLAAPLPAQQPDPPEPPVPGAVHELISALASHAPLPVDGEGALALDALRQPPTVEARRPLLLAAIDTLERGAAHRPGDASLQEALGVAYFDLARFDRAAEHFLRLVQMRPHHAQHHNDLGVALLRQGHVDEARRELQRALEMNRRRFAHLAAALARPPFATQPLDRAYSPQNS